MEGYRLGKESPGAWLSMRTRLRGDEKIAGDIY